MHIYCFGDSNTYGYDPRGFFGGRYGPGDRWPELLRQRTGWQITADGLSGRSIPRPTDLPPCLQADRVLIMLGTNDLLQGTAPEDAAAKMEIFLTALGNRGSRVLLVPPPAMKPGTWTAEPELIQHSHELIRRYEALAADLGIPCAPTGLWDIGLCYDGVHFTEEGHHTFAHHIREILIRLTEED